MSHVIGCTQSTQMKVRNTYKCTCAMAFVKGVFCLYKMDLCFKNAKRVWATLLTIVKVQTLKL